MEETNLTDNLDDSENPTNPENSGNPDEADVGTPLAEEYVKAFRAHEVSQKNLTDSSNRLNAAGTELACKVAMAIDCLASALSTKMTTSGVETLFSVLDTYDTGRDGKWKGFYAMLAHLYQSYDIVTEGVDLNSLSITFSCKFPYDAVDFSIPLPVLVSKVPLEQTFAIRIGTDIGSLKWALNRVPKIFRETALLPPPFAFPDENPNVYEEVIQEHPSTKSTSEAREPNGFVV